MPTPAIASGASTRIDVQLNPARTSWPVLRDGVLAAQDAGFDTAWVFDHFAGTMLGGTTMLECFTLVGALAAATTSIGLGTLVVNVNNRVPGVLAHAAASAQTISGGRFVLGVGAGAAPGNRFSAEHEVLGIELGTTLAARHARFVHALDELDRFWSPDRDAALATFPLPVPRPPVVVGVNSEPLARVAGERADGINVRSDHPELAALLDAARDARTGAGRGDEPWDCSVWAHVDEALLDPADERRQRWAALGVNRVVLVFFDGHDPAAIAAMRPSG